MAKSVSFTSRERLNWGKSITTRFYLNTSLKPIELGERKELYPVYVRVICQQKTSQFKYFGNGFDSKYFNQAEFEKVMEVEVDPTNIPSDYNFQQDFWNKYGFLKFQNNIEFILLQLDVFSKKSFSIKSLPIIIKDFIEIERIFLTLISRALIKDLYKNGYDPLIPVLDWSPGRHPSAIEQALNEIQSKYKIPLTKINYDSLPFIDVRAALEFTIKNYKIGFNTKQQVNNLIRKIPNVKGYDDLIVKIMTQLVEFYQKSTDLITK